MELPIRWVATFVAVVEHGHFGRAAHALHLSPSAVSKHVRGLEHELGSLLLVRRPGSQVETTVAGQRFVPAAEALLRAHEGALRAVRHAADLREVRLGVLAGVPFSPQQLDLVRAVVALRAPGWWVSLRRVAFTETLRCLVDEAVDVLWTGRPPRDPRVSATRIGQLERVALVGRRHPLAGAGSVPGEVFADLPLLHNPVIDQAWMEPFVLDDVRPAREGRLVPITATDYGTVLEHVRDGAGVAVTVGPVPPGARGAVVALRLPDVAPMPTTAAYRSSDRRSVVTTLVGALAELDLGTTRDAGPAARRAPGRPGSQLVPRRRWSET